MESVSLRSLWRRTEYAQCVVHLGEIRGYLVPDGGSLCESFQIPQLAARFRDKFAVCSERESLEQGAIRNLFEATPLCRWLMRHFIEGIVQVCAVQLHERLCRRLRDGDGKYFVRTVYTVTKRFGYLEQRQGVLPLC